MNGIENLTIKQMSWSTKTTMTWSSTISDWYLRLSETIQHVTYKVDQAPRVSNDVQTLLMLWDQKMMQLTVGLRLE